MSRYTVISKSASTPSANKEARRAARSLSPRRYRPQQPSKSQSASRFFHFPAEIRNEIYSQYFDGIACSSPHSLSLLLTCRAVYSEAHTLAFGTITFATTAWIRYKLATLSSILRRDSFQAITSLAFASHLLNQDVIGGNIVTIMAGFIANAITLFPGLKRLTLLHSAVYLETIQEESVHVFWESFLARGLVPVTANVLSGHIMAWPKNAPWEIIWPEDEDEGKQYHYCTMKRDPGQYAGPHDVRINWEVVQGPKQQATWLQMYTLSSLRDPTSHRLPDRFGKLSRGQKLLVNTLLSPVTVPIWVGSQAKKIWVGEAGPSVWRKSRQKL